jgi:hypothetical protein
VSTLVTGLLVVIAFQALGLGPALLLRSWAALPWRFVTLLTLGATATFSYGIFWIAFLAPALRLPIVGASLAASLAAAAIAVRRSGLAPLRQRDVWGPPLVTALLTVIYVCPLLIGGPGVNDRLAWKLPSDNILPGFFAHRVVLGASTERPVPPLWPGGDRASERPPLQAAVVVAVGSFAPGITGQEYQILATLCQAQWLPALWLIGTVCGFSRRTQAFVLAACAVSGFFFINSIYTWPKLFAAALMLGAVAIAMEAPPNTGTATRARVMLAAALGALALLAHPGPLFTLIALPLCWPLWRPIVPLRLTRRTTVIAVITIAVLGAPWLAYQTLVDPPTGRLMREHLADGRADGSAAAAIVGANVSRSIGDHVRIRAANLASQLGDPVVAIWPGSIGHGQGEQFFHHGASLGVLLLGLLIALAPPRPGTPDDSVRRLAIVALVALALWSLMVFAPGQALIHHGSPVTTALLFVAGAYGLTRLPPAAAWSLLGVHAVAFLYLWLIPVWRGPWLHG